MSQTYLGQNFLIDEAQQKRIVSHFDPPAEFMEIGPGRGALTRHLAVRFKDFYVYEKDPKLAKEHQEHSEYKTMVGNFLDWDFKIAGRAVENFSLIGNLPYESGSAMVQQIAQQANQVAVFLFLLQKEVVERICAQPKTRDFASFTVLVQGQFEVEALDIIAPECFRPIPKVYSQLVRGKRRQTAAHPLSQNYLKFLKRSFLHKRKTARNAWKSLMDQKKIDLLCEKFGFVPNTRAEEIAVDLWPRLYEEFKK